MVPGMFAAIGVSAGLGYLAGLVAYQIEKPPSPRVLGEPFLVDPGSRSARP
jgi:hypothetical protein